MHWEASSTVGLAGPGWQPDPLDASRLRWWDGRSWTARVARFEAGSDAIAWRADIADLAPPGPNVATPSMGLVPAVGTAPSRPDPGPLVIAPPPLAEPPPDEMQADEFQEAPDDPALAHPRGNRRAWAVLAAAVLILAAGAGVGSAVLGGGERPTVTDEITYRDDDADFALRYPDAWSIDKRTPGEGVSFVIGSKDAAPLDRNTLTVVAGTSDDQPPIRLEDLVVSTSADLIARNLVNFRLAEASEARLAGAPAFRVEFVDTTRKPEVRVVQYTGRTASGRPLLVGITVREPRTQATDEELARFLASITSS